MLNVTELPPFSTLPAEAVAGLLGQRRAFASLRQKGGEFVDIRTPEMATVTCYEEFLSWLVRCIVRKAAYSLQNEAGEAVAAHMHLRKDVNELTSALDLYIREWMFGESFDPLADAGWRMLLLLPLTAHIVRLFSAVLQVASLEGVT